MCIKKVAQCAKAVNFPQYSPPPLIFSLIMYARINPSSKLCDLGMESIQKDSFCLTEWFSNYNWLCLHMIKT